MDIRKGYNSLVTILVLVFVFSFAAYLEYRHEVETQEDSLKEELVAVSKNIDGMVSSRIINAIGMAGIVEVGQMLDRNMFDIFAEGIYDSEKHVVKDVVFITDTTITAVYPTYLGADAIGVDLSLIPEQKDLLLYTKEQFKTVFFGPVDLVEGGRGIIVRVPVVIADAYYGQVAIVFDYENFIIHSGLEELSRDNYVQLTGTNPLTKEVDRIWSSGDEVGEHFVSEGLTLNDIQWQISAEPHTGFTGTSMLFVLVNIIGTVAIVSIGITSYNEYKLKSDLEMTNIELVQTVEALAQNREEVLKQYHDIRQKEQYIQELADHDELTGLYNRRLFGQHLSTAIEEGREGLVVLIDLDDFKNVNDIHGHLYGDELLIEFSETLTQILGRRGRPYRFGGDEFLVLFEQSFSDDVIRSYAEHVQTELGKSIHDKVKGPITFSAGVVRFPEQGKDVKSLLIKADVAMYKSKSSGRNQLTIFEDSHLESLNKKLRIEDSIRKALKDDGFIMHYQPIVDSESAEIRSFEALIRMKDRSFSPMEFIEVAETTGLIVPLGQWILESVFTTLKSWITMGLEVKPVAVNISPRQLVEPDFRQMFMSLAKSVDIPLELIEIEITENVFLENEKENNDILQCLRDTGIRVSLDDFGTGYSSLKYLTYLPIDKVKIDKSLKDHLIAMHNDKVIAGAITMLHGLGMEVVAEGIEDQEEWAHLAKVGCDYLQGYHFSRPEPPEKILELLK